MIIRLTETSVRYTNKKRDIYLAGVSVSKLLNKEITAKDVQVFCVRDCGDIDMAARRVVDNLFTTYGLPLNIVSSGAVVRNKKKGTFKYTADNSKLKMSDDTYITSFEKAISDLLVKTVVTEANKPESRDVANYKSIGGFGAKVYSNTPKFTGVDIPIDLAKRCVPRVARTHLEVYPAFNPLVTTASSGRLFMSSAPNSEEKIIADDLASKAEEAQDKKAEEERLVYLRVGDKKIDVSLFVGGVSDEDAKRFYSYFDNIEILRIDLIPSFTTREDKVTIGLRERTLLYKKDTEVALDAFLSSSGNDREKVQCRLNLITKLIAEPLEVIDVHISDALYMYAEEYAKGITLPTKEAIQEQTTSDDKLSNYIVCYTVDGVPSPVAYVVRDSLDNKEAVKTVKDHIKRDNLLPSEHSLITCVSDELEEFRTYNVSGELKTNGNKVNETTIRVPLDTLLTAKAMTEYCLTKTLEEINRKIFLRGAFDYEIIRQNALKSIAAFSTFNIESVNTLYAKCVGAQTDTEDKKDKQEEVKPLFDYVSDERLKLMERHKEIIATQLQVKNNYIVCYNEDDVPSKLNYVVYNARGQKHAIECVTERLIANGLEHNGRGIRITKASVFNSYTEIASTAKAMLKECLEHSLHELNIHFGMVDAKYETVLKQKISDRIKNFDEEYTPSSFVTIRIEDDDIATPNEEPQRGMCGCCTPIDELAYVNDKTEKQFVVAKTINGKLESIVYVVHNVANVEQAVDICRERDKVRVGNSMSSYAGSEIDAVSNYAFNLHNVTAKTITNCVSDTIEQIENLKASVPECTPITDSHTSTINFLKHLIDPKILERVLTDIDYVHLNENPTVDDTVKDKDSADNETKRFLTAYQIDGLLSRQLYLVHNVETKEAAEELTTQYLLNEGKLNGLNAVLFKCVGVPVGTDDTYGNVDMVLNHCLEYSIDEVIEQLANDNNCNLLKDRLREIKNRLLATLSKINKDFILEPCISLNESPTLEEHVKMENSAVNETNKKFLVSYALDLDLSPIVYLVNGSGSKEGAMNYVIDKLIGTNMSEEQCSSINISDKLTCGALELVATDGVGDVAGTLMYKTMLEHSTKLEKIASILDAENKTILHDRYLLMADDLKARHNKWITTDGENDIGFWVVDIDINDEDTTKDDVCNCENLGLRVGDISSPDPRYKPADIDEFTTVAGNDLNLGKVHFEVSKHCYETSEYITELIPEKCDLKWVVDLYNKCVELDNSVIGRIDRRETYGYILEGLTRIKIELDKIRVTMYNVLNPYEHIVLDSIDNYVTKNKTHYDAKMKGE